MKLDYVPLLRVQRELHDIPRGMERFRQYLRTMLNRDGTDLELVPLVIMNPMGKEHVAALLDALLALDADGVGARAAAEASARLADAPGDFKAAVVVADDLMGGGTNRYAYEFDFRFGPAHLRLRTGPHRERLFWVTGVLWSSEAPTERAVREAVLTAAYRAAYVQRHGHAGTLRDMLAQEGNVMMMAGCTRPILDAEDLAYTREVLTPHLDADDMRTAIECLFGDAAARTLGFTPRGLSPWAGLALALHDAQPNPALDPTHFSPRGSKEARESPAMRFSQTSMPTIAALAVLGVVPLAGQAEEPTTGRKKLIEYGWDCPNTGYVRHNIAKMEERPFDGLIMQVTTTRDPRLGGTENTLGWRVFGNRRFQPEDYRHAVEDLKATRFHRFTDNFIQMISMPGIDWFDPGWSAVSHNARVLALVAREGGCVGLMFDPEEYGLKMWTYLSLPEEVRKKYSREQHVVKVIERGEEFMRAINSEFPAVKVLCLFGPALSLGGQSYDLLAPFVEGMCRAADPGSEIIDGYEQSYAYADKVNFEEGRRQMKVRSRGLFQDQASFDRVMRSGFGLWLDYNSGRRGWHASEFQKNHFGPDGFRDAARHALAVSDGYVWIYTERLNWWTGQGLPDAYREALEQARSE